MANNTSFAIELQGIDVPNEAKARIDEALQKTVMAELAKLDLASNASIEPLNTGSSTERSVVPSSFLPWPGGVMGFILRTVGVGVSGERSGIPAIRPPSVLSIIDPDVPLPLTDPAAFAAVCQRPDIRQAIISNSQALMELLSADDQASKNFNTLMNQLNQGQQPTGERIVPLVIVAICVGAAALGGLVGWASRPKS
ncbi:MAG TPA: hypothetical protein VFK88_02180 [Gallionella sp.]|nr:hypothetical protein [Gallionella sp.]